jgi:hypothetical protein
MTDPRDQQLARAAALLRQQTARIAELEAEVERLNAVIDNCPDALTHLQKVYTDPRASTSTIIRAAGAALPFERAKPPSVSAHFDGATLFNVLEAKRLAKRKPAVIDVTPSDPAA